MLNHSPPQEEMSVHGQMFLDVQNTLGDSTASDPWIIRTPPPDCKLS